MAETPTFPVLPQVTLLRVYSAIAAGYTAVFGVVFALLVPNPLLAAIHFGAFAIVLANYALFTRLRNVSLATHVILGAGVAVVSSLFATGGLGGSGALWILAYLPYAFFLANQRAAAAWVATLFAICVGSIGAWMTGILPWPYTPLYTASFVTAFLVFSFCMFLFVFARDRYASDAGRLHREASAAAATLQAALESTADGILVVDNGGAIVAFNDRWRSMWGIDAAILSTLDNERVRASVLPKVKDAAQFVASTKAMYASSTESSDWIELVDGRVFQRISIPFRVDGAALGRVLSFRDMTASREAQEVAVERRSLEISNERLRESQAFQRQFMNNAAHELATPITPVKIQVHLLKGGELGPLSPEQQHAVQVIARNVDHMLLLLRDVLDSARVQSAQLDLNLATTDVGRLAHDATDTFKSLAEAEGVTLDREIAAHLATNADGRRITQVLLNLIRNAVKFTPRGGRVDVRAYAAENDIVVEVHDTGRGIPQDQIARLFRPFSQIHVAGEAEKPGSGLGLFVSKGIIEQHGGQIGVRSGGPNQGATFWFSLPVVTMGGLSVSDRAFRAGTHAHTR
ncbi:MAG: sensor histidine kinase [Thermoplasmatota archaeon]